MSAKMQHILAATSLIVAVLASGLLAGVYFAYATSVMTALGKFDDKTFVEVMNKINVVIVNPWFMFAFLGSVAFPAVAAALHLRQDSRTVLIWIGIALVLNVISLLISGGANIPLNDKLATATDAAGPVDFAGLRQQFESSWVGWNIVRALANTAATGALAWSLVLYGRKG